MNAAETMRRAAALMRERADAATEGPWQVLDSIHRDPYVIQKGRGILTGGCVALASGEDYGKGNVEHIASWDPTMARVVADLLDAGADEFDRRAAKYGIDSLASANPTAQALIAVATTYLAEES